MFTILKLHCSSNQLPKVDTFDSAGSSPQRLQYLYSFSISQQCHLKKIQPSIFADLRMFQSASLKLMPARQIDILGVLILFLPCRHVTRIFTSNCTRNADIIAVTFTTIFRPMSTSIRDRNLGVSTITSKKKLATYEAV